MELFFIPPDMTARYFSRHTFVPVDPKLSKGKVNDTIQMRQNDSIEYLFQMSRYERVELSRDAKVLTKTAATIKMRILHETSKPNK